ncbi:MAG: type I methionyl aminopeptidase [Acidimicrobiia bacterium]|nr:type I methionyl aminopeptidase [Acidimicrobiia bacterium]
MFLTRSIPVRTAEELAGMRRAGRVVGEMHERIREAIRPGVTTEALDRIGRDVLERRGATSNFLGYHGYPAVICASPNDVVVHGIPSEDVILAEGDVVSIDCGAIVDGWHGDAAFTAGVGEIGPQERALIAVADAALAAAIDAMVDGGRLGDIGAAVQTVVESSGFAVVRDYTGHGIGRAMHEDPAVHNTGRAGTGTRLRSGNVLAIEPMVSTGTDETVVLADGWSVLTADGSWSAHTEHTVAVTDDGPEVLTVLS